MPTYLYSDRKNGGCLGTGTGWEGRGDFQGSKETFVGHRYAHYADCVDASTGAKVMLRRTKIYTTNTCCLSYVHHTSKKLLIFKYKNKNK